MWGRFFDSIGHDDESALSGSNLPRELQTPPPFKDSPLKMGPDSPEVHPDDSASVVDHESNVSFPMLRRGATMASSMGGSVAQSIPAVDDGTYVFKFRTPSARTHRFQARHDNVEHLRDIVAGKLETDPFFAAYNNGNANGNANGTAMTENGDAGEGDALPFAVPNPHDFSMLYTDADGDTVLITSDSDVTDAVKIARNAGHDRVVLLIQGGKGWEDTNAQAEAKAAQINATAKEEVIAVEKLEAAQSDVGSSTNPGAHVPATDDVMGIPRDMILPASIGALAVVIIAVFTISRFSD